MSCADYQPFLQRTLDGDDVDPFPAELDHHLMICPDCRERTYHTENNKRNDPDRMTLNKFCPRCRKHTEHREVK